MLKKEAIMPNYLSSNLVFLRKLFRVSQAQLASQLNKGQTTIGNWENQLSQPSVEDLLIIKHFFAISLDDLIETDLVSVKATDLPGVIEKPGIVELSVEENVKESRKKARAYGTNDSPGSQVKEAGAAGDWATFKVLQQMDQKLDQLLVLAGFKPKNGAH